MKRYEDIRPQLAEAALIYLADRKRIDTIVTLDRRDFSVYRSARKRAFRILPDVCSLARNLTGCRFTSSGRIPFYQIATKLNKLNRLADSWWINPLTSVSHR